jgi:tetratricopeptide (TPR) repeat protein
LTPLRELAGVQPAAGPGAAPHVPIEIAGDDVSAHPAGPGLTENDREPTAVNAPEEAVSAGLLARTSLLDSPQGQPSLPALVNPASGQPVDETSPGGAAVETESEPTPPAPAHLGKETQPATSRPPGEVPTEDSVDQQVERLIALAETALEKDRLLIPAHDSAFEYYRQILDLEPGNAIAEDGLDRIVKRYQELAQQAANDGDWDEAQRFLGRGLRVRPGDAAVLAMREQVSTEAAKEQLEMALAAEEAALLLQPVEPSDPEPVEHDGGPPPGTEPRGLMGRLKAFFTRSSEPTQETDARR